MPLGEVVSSVDDLQWSRGGGEVPASPRWCGRASRAHPGVLPDGRRVIVDIQRPVLFCRHEIDVGKVVLPR